MFICGSNFVGGALACAITPTAINNINYVELKNGMYDDLYITTKTDFEITSECPTKWDYYTVLYAPFNGNTHAGNVDWNLETISHLLLKKRNEGDFLWQTLLVKDVNDIEDFKINHSDYLATSGAIVEYAIVPVSNGVEGSYAISEKIPFQFDKIFVISEDTVWGTIISDCFCDTTRNVPSTTVTLLNNKYPIFVRNTIANYDTGTCTGAFVPLVDGKECEFAYDRKYDYKRISYQRDFMDFISNGIPKILKLPDGRIWIIQVTANPTDTANWSYNNRYISFPWVEIGDVNSEADLYYLGLSDVTEEWWNQ